jgi:superfamily II DNA or RNA helicase
MAGSDKRYEDCESQLDQLVVAYITHRKLRIVTRHQGVVGAVTSQFVAKWKTMERGRFKVELEELYQVQRRKFGIEIATLSGLMPLLAAICKQHLVPLIAVDVPRETQVENYMLMPPLEFGGEDEVWGELRDWQQPALRLMRHTRCGRFKAATGSGKSTLIGWFCRLAYKSRILVTTSSVGGVMDLHAAILSQGVGAGLINGKVQRGVNERVVCCTTGSLGRIKHLPYDVLIGDEVHEHASKHVRAAMWPIAAERIFGFSANQNDRKGGGDICVEGLYGPLLFSRTYQENLAAGDVSQIAVRFVPSQPDKHTLSKQPSIRERVLLVQNSKRNQQIADIARHYVEQENRQVLILVRNTEHCLRIRHHLPEAVAVFRQAKDERWSDFTKWGLTREGEIEGYSIDQLQGVQAAFKRRELMLVVANSVWFKGKDFPSLDVVIRGEAMSTPVANTQLAGRLSRVYQGKTRGLLVDFMDEWDPALRKRYRARFNYYESQGWEILPMGQ